MGASWSDLPGSLLAGDLGALAATWEGRPPRLLRPRVEAEAMRVVSVSTVEHIGYDPAEQRLEAAVRDEAGTRAGLRVSYRPVCPGALDALAEALKKSAASPAT
ncbi:hypothetical protein ACFY8O_16020 [Streptomyces argenteolus]|uniref:Uncharacterized protein n=1 Tax=Streptomyces argenteolus TaxID=67274 RepID=A0ABW6X5R8_9ACTN